MFQVHAEAEETKQGLPEYVSGEFKIGNFGKRLTKLWEAVDMGKRAEKILEIINRDVAKKAKKK